MHIPWLVPYSTKFALTLAIVSIAVLSLAGCNNKTVTSGASSESKTEVSSSENADDKADDGPLPVMGTIASLDLIDQDGNAYSVSKLDDKVSIVNFFFTSCTSTCPVQTQEMAKLQKEFTGSASVQFLSVSVNPEVDSADVLKSYAKRFDADTNQWHFLTGTRADVWELSKKQFMLPVGDAPENQGMPIFHSPKFVLLDNQRQIRGFFDSSSRAELTKLTQYVSQLAAESKSSAATEQENAPQVSDLIVVPAELESSNAPSVSDLENALDSNTFKNANAPATRDVYVPHVTQVKPDWLATRAKQQLSKRSEFEVLHDFKFQDTCRESGIDWKATIVADAAKEYIAAHYDHGNGIAVADVDGDGLFDFYLTSQLGANALLKNLGEGKFQDVANQAGVEMADRIGVTASFADYDNDGDADLFVTTVRGGNALFRNDGDFKFTDVSQEAGIDYVGHSSAAVFFDYDRDGLLDLFVTNVGKYTTEEIGPGGYYRSFTRAFSGHLRPDLTEPSILYKNIDGKRFEDVTEAMKLDDGSWSGAATPIDANNDGWPDLYILDMQGHDEYFENLQGKGFQKRSRELFPKTPWGAMGVKVFDFDNDGRLDLYITDMHSDMSEKVGIDKEKLKANMKWPESMLRTKGQSVWGNALYHKQADGSYEEISDAVGAENYWPWGLSVDDLNADGWQDAFLASSMNLPLRYGVNSVLLNNRGKKFLDSEFILGVEPRRDGVSAIPWFTLDCDGPDRSHKYAKQLGITSGQVTVWSALGSRSSAIFDMDNDGDLDIVTNDFNSPPMVLTSDLAQRHKINYLKVKLVGTKSNKDGLGAVVQLTSSLGKQTKVHDGQSGYLSQSSKELYFGLGSASEVDRVEVTWPSGKKQIANPSKINSLLTIREE